MCNDTRAVNEREPAGQVRAFVAAAALLVMLVATPVPARADDAVMEWNQIALAATVRPARGPCLRFGPWRWSTCPYTTR